MLTESINADQEIQLTSDQDLALLLFKHWITKTEPSDELQKTYDQQVSGTRDEEPLEIDLSEFGVDFLLPPVEKQVNTFYVNFPWFVLAASAGTGKTFVAIEMIRFASTLSEYPIIGIAAPTHKAVRIIADKLRAAGIPIKHNVSILKPRSSDGMFWSDEKDLCGNVIVKPYPQPGIYVGTLHQFLAAQPDGEDQEEDDQEFKPTRGTLEQPIAQCNLFVCDEASMLGEWLFGCVKDVEQIQREFPEESNDRQTQFLMIGDEFQLFPVENVPKTSPVFDEPNQVPMYQVVRYDGQILRVATDIRDMMRTGKNVKPYSFGKNSTSDFTLVVNKNGYEVSDWFKLLTQYLKERNEGENNNPDSIRVAVYTRKRMQEVNNRVRRSLYGAESSVKFFAGEWLFTHGLASQYISLAERMEKVTEKINNNEAATINVSVRLGNSRDFKVQDSFLERFPIESPLAELKDFPRLSQTFCRVIIKAWDKETEQPEETSFAVLTDTQLEEFKSNYETLSAYLKPIIDNLSQAQAKATGQKEQEIRKKYLILSKFLKHYQWCLNVQIEDKRGKERQYLCKLQSGIAVTTHKLQGSTIDNIFVMYNDFFSARQNMNLFFRLLYTAITRGKESVKIYSLYP